MNGNCFGNANQIRILNWWFLWREENVVFRKKNTFRTGTVTNNKLNPHPQAVWGQFEVSSQGDIAGRRVLSASPHLCP